MQCFGIQHMKLTHQIEMYFQLDTAYNKVLPESDGAYCVPSVRKLYVPLEAAQSGLIYQKVTGAIIYTQIGPPILHDRSTQTEPVPIKINVAKERDVDGNMDCVHPSGVPVVGNGIGLEPSDFSGSQGTRGQEKSRSQFTPHIAMPVDCWPEDRPGHRPELCLATYRVSAHYRDYYLDVKENGAGMYVKMVEVDRPRASVAGKVYLRMHAVFDMRRHFDRFRALVGSLHINPCQPNGTGVLEGRPIRSEVVFSSNRRYYLDLVTNRKGSFLKIKQTTVPEGPRSSLVIGAVGLGHFHDAFTHLLMRFATGGALLRPLPQRPHVNSGDFYFDVGQNQAGVYVRISRVGEGGRAITVPMAGWADFRDIFDAYIADVGRQRGSQAGPGKRYAFDTESL